jgi:hypothetical protein
MSTFQKFIFDTYVAAYDHAQEKTRCAHVSTGVVIDGVLSFVTVNSSSLHAEIEALKALREKEGLQCERGTSRFNCHSFPEDRGTRDGQALF